MSLKTATTKAARVAAFEAALRDLAQCIADQRAVVLTMGAR